MLLVCACALLLGALPLPCVARAGAPSQPPQTQNLGEGLSYFRVTNLAGQLPDIRAALEKHPALVLDLRGAAGNITAAQALRTALVPAKPDALVARFVLINAATTPAISFALGGGIAENSVPRTVVIAPASADVPADVKTPATAEDDKRACEAIAKGAPLATLLNHQPDKPRNDEAALVREQNGDDQQDSAAADAPAAPAKPVPLTDSVLQLAVQIHRSLLALKKL